MKKMLAAALAALMATSMITACGGSSGSGNASASSASSGGAAASSGSAVADDQFANSDGKFTEDGKFKVGFLCASMNDAWNYLCNLTVKEVFEENAPDYIELVQIDGQSDAQKYVEFYEQVLMEGDYGLICTPAISDFGDYYDQIMESGTAVLNYNVTQNEILEAGKVSVYRCSDYDCGANIAQYVIDHVEPGSKGVILEGKAGMVSVMLRYQGITETLEGSGLEILAVQNADWSNDTAYTVVTDWLTTYGDFDFIISENDNMALGAIEAIQAAGKNPADFCIVGIDGLYNGVAAVANGTMSASARQDTMVYAEDMLQMAIDIATGARPYKTVDYKDYAPEMITIDNAQEFIDYYTEKGLDQ